VTQSYSFEIEITCNKRTPQRRNRVCSPCECSAIKM